MASVLLTTEAGACYEGPSVLGRIQRGEGVLVWRALWAH